MISKEKKKNVIIKYRTRFSQYTETYLENNPGFLVERRMHRERDYRKKRRAPFLIEGSL